MTSSHSHLPLMQLDDQNMALMHFHCLCGSLLSCILGILWVNSSQFTRRDQKPSRSNCLCWDSLLSLFPHQLHNIYQVLVEVQYPLALSKQTSPSVPGCIARQLNPGYMADAISPWSVNGASACLTVTGGTFTTAATPQRWRKTTGLGHLLPKLNQRVFDCGC